MYLHKKNIIKNKLATLKILFLIFQTNIFIFQWTMTHFVTYKYHNSKYKICIEVVLSFPVYGFHCNTKISTVSRIDS